MTKLLLIESPGKLKKLSQILGSDWIVKASMGHIRELADDGEDALGFDIEGHSIHCRYEPRSPRAKTILKELRQVVQQATEVYIATDPDREGETIGWHLQQELRLKQPKRITYTEITKPAVLGAISHPKTLDQNLIAAGRARDCLDKLVGYKGSKHLVWALKNGAKSMGRVQSATLHLLCQREKEIQVFVPQDYWSVWVEYLEGFKAFYRRSLNPTEGEESQAPDDAKTEKDKSPESDRVTSQAEADRLVEIAKTHPHRIVQVERKTTYQSPPAAFTTSTLQQAAGAKLRFAPEFTMKVAQSLYEKGYITYMRTDSVVLSEQFCTAVRQYLEQNDPENVPNKVARHHSTKGAQEAHEAIRPTDVYLLPEQLSERVGADEAKLYELIWNRAVASQCRPAQLAKTRIVTQSGEVFWEARGQVLVFPGYTVYWNNISSDKELPAVQEGQAVTLKEANSEKKQTQPPPRYTEPKLVQLMERKGVGRPSTYSPTIKTLKERQYVQLMKGKLQPTPLGMELDGFLEQVLPDLITAEFTARMEQELDAIASGKLDWERYLTGWNREYFDPALKKAIQAVKGYSTGLNSSESKRSSGESKLSSAETTDIQCPKCGKLMVKVTSKSPKVKTGHFLSCDSRQGGCGAVMFKNQRSGNYELPYAERSASSSNSEKSALFSDSRGSAIQPNLEDSAPRSRAKRSASQSSSEASAPRSRAKRSASQSSSEASAPRSRSKRSVTQSNAEDLVSGSRPKRSATKTTAASSLSDNLTEFSCPVCQTPLEKFPYTDKKTGQAKTMLRCSNGENRKSRCKDVAFWWTSRNQWWSPTYGEIGSDNSQLEGVEQKSKTKSKTTNKRTKKKPASA